MHVNSQMFAAITAATFVALSACAPTDVGGEAAGSASPAASADAAAPAQAEGVHPFRIGALQAWALKDGGMDVPNDNKVFGVGLTPEPVAEVLRAANVPDDKLSLSIQPLLVKTGDRMVLMDAGAGAAYGPAGGALPARLQAAGIDPASVTDVVISHSHGDHVVGLVGVDGALTFPNARVHIAEAEWAFMKTNPKLASVVTAVTPKVAVVQPGAAVAPGVTTFAIAGHTPGHMGVEIASGGERLTYVGDTVHHYVVSLAKPEWRIQFDTDAPTAQASRQALLQRLADQRAKVYAVHFPFPGIGYVRAQGDGFVWEPAA